MVRVQSSDTLSSLHLQIEARCVEVSDIMSRCAMKFDVEVVEACT